jgi:hypothetical protein
MILLGPVPVYRVGYTAGAWILGRAVTVAARGARRSRSSSGGEFREAALVPFLGGLVTLAATVFGSGALVATVRAARTPAASPGVSPSETMSPA